MTTSPKPWKIETAANTCWHGYPEWNTYTVRDARNCCIAVVGEIDRLPAPENEDNARIMALAPELLDALKKALLREAGRDWTQGDYADMTTARTAIAKAEAE